MIICNKCGTRLPDGAKVCSVCGTRLITMQTQCPHCGQALPPGQTYCPRCGAVFRSSDNVRNGFDYEKTPQRKKPNVAAIVLGSILGTLVVGGGILTAVLLNRPKAVTPEPTASSAPSSSVAEAASDAPTSTPAASSAVAASDSALLVDNGSSELASWLGGAYRYYDETASNYRVGNTVALLSAENCESRLAEDPEGYTVYGATWVDENGVSHTLSRNAIYICSATWVREESVNSQCYDHIKAIFVLREDLETPHELFFRTYVGYNLAEPTTLAIDDIPTTPVATTITLPTPVPASDYYILPDSSTRYLTGKDLAGLSTHDLMLARNEIFARHGRKFNDSELNAYFSSQSWYKGTIEPGDFNNSMLSTIEQTNVDFIRSYEKGSAGNTTVTSEYILPQSSTRKLTYSDISGLSSHDLMLARNEIYARHGRKFNDSELNTYFNSKSWYYGTIDPSSFSEALLNDVEKYNIQFIKSYE